MALGGYKSHGHQHRTPQLFQDNGPRYGLGSSPDPDTTIIPIALGGKQATHISPFLTALNSLDSSLFPAHEPSFLFLSHFTTIYPFTVMVVDNLVLFVDQSVLGWSCVCLSSLHLDLMLPCGLRLISTHAG